MKYFVKYLPVEGEIKVGDDTIETLITGEKMLWHIDNQNDIDKDNQVKVKLFLCSKDIQVGDKFKAECPVLGLHDGICYAIDDLGTELVIRNVPNEYGTGWDSKVCFKVIGEISPEATWVKEGDEFGEEDILISRHYKLDSGKLSKKLRIKDYHNREVKLCKIKGPCGDFH